MLSIKGWAQDKMSESTWPDWILYRDAAFFNQSESYGMLAIPNGIHPVICVDLTPDKKMKAGDKSVDIKAFLPGGIEALGSYAGNMNTRAKESWLKSSGIIRDDETLVETVMYTRFLAEYQKHNMPTIQKPRSVHDDAGWKAYRKAIDEIEDPLLKESIRYCGDGLSVYDFNIPF